MADLTKLIEDSAAPSFQNNKVYTGTFTFTGTVVAGTNTKTFSVPLSQTPDLVDIVFNGPTDTVFSSDPRPSTAWFKQGSIWVIGNGSTVTNFPTPWVTYGVINGTTLTITCTYVQQFVDTITLTSTNASYRVIDYSVFP